MRARLARLLLRPFLGRREAEAVVEDLEDLASDRPGLGRTTYFWTALLGFPLRAITESLRGHLSAAGGHRRGGGGMDGFTNDVRYALRSLRRSPGFVAMTVAILALSMGAATSIFSVVKGVLLDPLPVEHPERVRNVWLRYDSGTRARMTPGTVTDLRALDDVFEGTAAFQGSTAALRVDQQSMFVRGGQVTPGYFATLGVRPLLGRIFHDDEGVRGGPNVIVLGERLWRRVFGADPAVLGRNIQLDGTLYEVVGVAPAGVYPTSVTVGTEMPFTEANQDYFLPLRFSAEFWDQRRSHILGALVRLREGVEVERADAALATLSSRLRATEPLGANETLESSAFADEVFGDVRFGLLTLLGTVGLVLLIAVVNVGALFLLRGDDRGSEFDIRRALGAPSGRLARQLMVESSLVALVSAAGAVAVARIGLTLMKGLVPFQIPRLNGVVVDRTGLLVTVVLGMALAVAFGLIPAWRLFSGHGARGVRTVTAGAGQRILHGWIVGVQAALGVLVLVGALLLTRSFAALQAVDPGFSALETWVVPVSGAGDGMDDLVRAVRDLPGVRSAAVTYDHPLQRNWGDSFLIEGRVLGPDDPIPGGSLRPFGDGYFETVGIEAIEGEIPDALDLTTGAGLAVINESLRDAYFPDGDAVGSVIDVPTARRNFGDEAGSFTIVAVVGDVHFLGPDRPAEPAFYLPLAHFPVGGENLLVRPTEPSVEVVAAVRRTVESTMPGAALQSANRLQDILNDQNARPRFNMMLLVSFAAMGLILCGLGAYGLVGRTVVSRLREIGIRMALGAERAHLARSVIGVALRPLVLGGLVGVVAAMFLGGLLRSLLFEVTPNDPVSLAGSALFLGLVGLLAAIVPTVRALGVDPAHTLRHE